MAFLEPRCELIQSNDLIAWSLFLRDTYSYSYSEMEGVETFRREFLNFTPSELRQARCPEAEVQRVQQAMIATTSRPASSVKPQPLKQGECRRSPQQIFPEGARISRSELDRRLQLECGPSIGDTDEEVVLYFDRKRFLVKYTNVSPETPDLINIISVRIE